LKVLESTKKQHCRGSTPEQQQQQQQQQQQHDSEDNKTCMARPLDVSANWSYMIKLLGETTPTAQFLIDNLRIRTCKGVKKQLFQNPVQEPLHSLGASFHFSLRPFSQIYTAIPSSPCLQ